MKYRVLCGDQTAEVQIKPGKPIVLDGALHTIGL
jgi:hypothetical protein